MKVVYRGSDVELFLENGQRVTPGQPVDVPEELGKRLLSTRPDFAGAQEVKDGAGTRE